MDLILKYLSIIISFTYLTISGGQVESAFRFDQPPTLSVSPEVTYPGDALFVTSSLAGSIEFNGKLYKLQKGTDKYSTFISIPINQTPDQIQITLRPEQKGDVYQHAYLTETLKSTVTVNQKDFSTQYLEISDELEDMSKNTKKIEEDRKKVQQALSNPIQQPLMLGEFFQPLEGRISTMFGYTRYVNGELDSRHLAIDIAAPEGTPIIAPNYGKVVLADTLYLSGNRVIIDHGSYLYSSFSHMKKLNVKVGDRVGKGDIIGWVGSTGFSTGPHLHHAFYVRGYAVNPEIFFNKDPSKW